MNITGKIRLTILTCLLLACLFLTGQAGAEKLKLDDPAATVDGKEIQASEVLIKSRLASRVRGTSFHRSPLHMADSLQYQFLDGLIDQVMLENVLGPEVSAASKQEAQQIADELARQFKSEADFLNHLRGLGLNPELYTWQTYKRILLEKAAADDGLTPPVLTEDELIRTYEENPERWKSEEKARIELLVINPDKSAPNQAAPEKIRNDVLEARQRLVNGELIDDLAARFADQRKDIEAGGGRLSVTKADISPSMHNFVFEGPLDTWTPPLEYGEGYCTLRVVSRGDTKPSMQELQQSMYEELVATPWNNVLEKLRRTMRKKATTEIFLGQRSLRDSEGNAPSTPQIIFLSLTFLLIGAFLYFTRHRHGWPQVTVCIFIIGLALRLAAWYATPFDIRAQDAYGHIEYIEEVKEGNWLPAADQGFMFYQPPLYYWMASLIPENPSHHYLQIFSLLLSWAALAAAIWSLSACWPKTSGRASWGRYACEGLLATAPTLIYFAPRINNDSLAALFLFLVFGLILRWWKTGDARYWWLTAIFCGLGLLTKNTLLPLGPVVLISLLFHPQGTMKNRLLQLSGGAAILLLMVGWLWLTRYGGEGSPGLVSNLAQLSQQQKFEPTAAKLLTVNPFRLIDQPFLISWFKSDEREFFIEYALRSALFTQFYHPGFPKWLGSGVMAVALAFLLLAGIKAYHFTRESWRDALPFLATILFVCLAHLLLVINAPYISSHNFRYSVILLLPAFFLACAPLAGKQPWLNRISLICAGTMILGFLVSVTCVLTDG